MSNQTTNSSTRDWLKVLPCDAWFFRDGSPFNRGEDHGESGAVFPPFPSTLSGAIRFALATTNAKSWDGKGTWKGQDSCDGTKLESVVGDGPDQLGQLTFVGPLIYQNTSQELLLPVPRHLLGLKTLALDGLHRFTPCDWLVPGDELICEGVKTRLPQPKSKAVLKENERHPETPEGLLITAAGMKKVFEGNLPAATDFVDIHSIARYEQRVGIARNPRTGRVDESMLYSPKFIRLAKDCGLVYGLEGKPDSWKLPTQMMLGGESRMTTLEQTTPPSLFNGLPNISSGNAVLVLLTPAHFSNSNKWWGASPGEDASHLHFSLTGKVVTTIVDRPLRIGGWSSVAGGSKHKGPQSMRPHARAGTCWYIGDWPESQDRLIQVGDGTSHGYGLAIACKVPSDPWSFFKIN